MKRALLLLTLLCLTTTISAQTTDRYVDSLKKNHTREAGYCKATMPSVRFDYDFESGSLGRAECLYADRSKKEQNSVFLIESRSDPRNPFDSTYITSGRWFFFRMIGTQNRTIHLLFKNTDTMYPVYSYDGEQFERFTEQESAKGCVRKTFDRDTIYIAYSLPYTHNRLMRRTAQWMTDSCLNVYMIGLSAQYRPIYLYTFCDSSVAEAQKQQVYIHSRIHPSETPASFVLEGLIDALMERKDLLRRITFHIVPFTNPDGVAGGHSRSNTIGVNLENNFLESTSPTQPETETLLRTVEQLYAKQPLDVMLNIHAQVTPKLMMWLHTAASSSEVYHCKEMAFFNIVAQHNPLFSPADSTFSKLPKNCIERWAWESGKGRTLALTFEATYEQLNTDPKTWVTEGNMLFTGRKLLDALDQFLVIPHAAQRLMKAYPMTLVEYSVNSFITVDNKKIACNDTIFTVPYPKGALSAPPTTDPGRIRDENLLKAMYGSTPQEVKSNLVAITWCPKLVGQKLLVNSRNNIHLALQKVSNELDRNPKWKKYLRADGTYVWRTIAGSNQLSAHSFGIAIDLGVEHSNYWKWDHPEADESTAIDYRNKFPQEIVDIFEKHGFIWGGKWSHYDTMHFEYRPELLQ